MTDARLTRLKPWKIMPMPALISRSSRPDAFATSRSPTSTEPLVMGTRPLMARMRRGLAGTRQADEDQELAVRDVQRQVAERPDAASIGDRGVPGT